MNNTMQLTKFASISVTPLLLMATTVPAAAPTAGNWNNTIVVTPEGGHVLGNPKAALKLTEFISYTCPHCAAFDREGSDRMRVYLVAPGKLSIEIRNFVRDPIDMTVAMLTNCGPASKFVTNHTAFLRGQPVWIARAEKISRVQRNRWISGDQPSRFRAMATDFGFYAIMEQRGYTRTAVDRCLADGAMAKSLAEQTKAASALGVEGTPSFMLNGELLAGTHTWDALKLQLEARSLPQT
jgi:protein-disulfide isomerase